MNGANLSKVRRRAESIEGVMLQMGREEERKFDIAVKKEQSVI